MKIQLICMGGLKERFLRDAQAEYVKRLNGCCQLSVTEIDPAAFIIVCEAHEVLGEGFGEYSPDNL